MRRLVAERKKQAEEKEAEALRAALDAMSDEWENHYGANEQRGKGAGCGVFDVVAGCPRGEWHGRNYSEKDKWSDEMADEWERQLTQARAEASIDYQTLRLFQATWQGQEMPRDKVVSALGSALQPIGEVHQPLAELSDVWDSEGVMPNGNEDVDGAGGGCYVPIRMKQLTPEVVEQCKQRWGGYEPRVAMQAEGAEGVELWDAPAGCFTIEVPMLTADKEEAEHLEPHADI